MSCTKIALAIPLALGMACSTSGGEKHTGAMWSEGQPRDAATQAYMQGTGSGGSQDPSAAQPGSGASSSDTASPGSGSSGSSDAAGSPGSPASSDTSGGAMGAGGSSETMGSGSTGGSSDQGASGTSDQGQQGASAGPGNTGAHAGDQHIMGKISKVSDDEISIKPRSGKAKTLKINPDTTVSINGKDAKPSQLKQGQSVRASYENVSGDDVAVRIESGKMMRHGRMKHGAHGAGASDTSNSGSGGSGSSPGSSSGGADTGPGGSGPGGSGSGGGSGR